MYTLHKKYSAYSINVECNAHPAEGQCTDTVELLHTQHSCLPRSFSISKAVGL